MVYLPGGGSAGLSELSQILIYRSNMGNSGGGGRGEDTLVETRTLKKNAGSGSTEENPDVQKAAIPHCQESWASPFHLP